MRDPVIYPQLVLLVAPILLRGVWALIRPVLLGLAPRVRATILFVTIVLPVAAVFVPYLPGLAAYLPFPWRAPAAWGFANFPALEHGVGYALAIAGCVVLVAVPPAALAVLVIRSARLSRSLARLGGRRCAEGFTLVPGRDTALTVGLLRPRVLLSGDVWASEHGAVILRHELAHARGRHPLVLVLARAALTLWWWVPGSATLLGDLRDALEQLADAQAARAVGRVRVARAIVDRASTVSAVRGPVAAFGFGGQSAAEGRIAELARAPRSRAGWVALAGCGVLAVAWLLLF